MDCLRCLVELMFMGYSLGDTGLSVEFLVNLFQTNNSRHIVIFNIDIIIKIEIR